MTAQGQSWGPQTGLLLLGHRRGDLPLYELCGGPGVRSVTNWAADNDVIGALLKGLRYRNHSFLVVAGPIFDRADARRDDQQTRVEVLAQERRLEACRHHAIAARF